MRYLPAIEEFFGLCGDTYDQDILQIGTVIVLFPIDMTALLMAKCGIEIDPELSPASGQYSPDQRAVPIRTRGAGHLALCRQLGAQKCIGVVAVWSGDLDN